MAVVALLLPERPELPDLDPERVEAFVLPYGKLLQRLREERPEGGSSAERELVLEAARLNLELQKEAESQWLEVLRSGTEERFREIIEAELESADADKKLSIRLLQQSLSTQGVFVEWVAGLYEGLEASGLLSEMIGWLDNALDEGAVELDQQSVALFRWQLDLLVAVRCIQSSPAEELAWWARRCSIGSRKVLAMLASPALPGWRGEVARQKARSSWKRWDDEEIERELAPWPDL